MKGGEEPWPNVFVNSRAKS